MHYIVFDLEWNQCPYGKASRNPRLPFEIIEIGAVKLDEHFHIVDTFHEIITPQVYKKLHWMTKSVIALSDQDLKGHKLFPQAARAFFDWCGSNYRLCTWGTCDLGELQRNIDFYHIENPFSFPLLYMDAQKLFGLAFEGKKTARSLEFAVDYLHIEKQERFHGAYSDALYTAEIIQHLPQDKILSYVSVDTYRIPADEAHELYLQFPTYTKYVSRAFKTRDDAMQNKTVTACICSECGRRCRRKIHWFPVSSKNFLCLALCPDHGFIKGKIRIKQRPDGSVFVIKTHKLIGEEGAAALRQLKIESKKKHKFLIKD